MVDTTATVIMVFHGNVSGIKRNLRKQASTSGGKNIKSAYGTTVTKNNLRINQTIKKGVMKFISSALFNKTY